MNCHSAGTFSALTISVLDRHNFVGKVALIHVKVQAIHGDELHERYVISLLLRVWDMIAEHEATAFTRVSMEIDKHFEALVLLSLLNNSLPRGPDRRMIALGGRKVHTIQIAGHRIQTVVPP